MWTILLLIPECCCYLQHPATIGCDSIQDYEIWYRPADSDDWDKKSAPTASSTSYTLTGLEQEDYVIRVVVFNNDDFTNYAEVIFFLGIQLYYASIITQWII